MFIAKRYLRSKQKTGFTDIAIAENRPHLAQCHRRIDSISHSNEDRPERQEGSRAVRLFAQDIGAEFLRVAQLTHFRPGIRRQETGISRVHRHFEIVFIIVIEQHLCIGHQSICYIESNSVGLVAVHGIVSNQKWQSHALHGLTKPRCIGRRIDSFNARHS